MLTTTQAVADADIWSEWLLHNRHADNHDLGDLVQATVGGYADRVLAGAKLEPGMTLVDVGAGEGLVAFRAIDRIGTSLRVILTDISRPMLNYAEEVAEQRKFRDQCTFIECPADRLDDIGDGSVDVVATRSVLAYVSDKCSALREFYRVLKPGGRISIAEPILQDEALFARVLRMRVESQRGKPVDHFLSLLHRWKSAQFPDTEERFATSSHVNYNERNLLKFVLDSGFCEAHLELHIDVKPSLSTSWSAFLGSSPHPWAPPLTRILAEQFSADERKFFEQIFRPGVESGQNVSTERIVFITAVKPL